MSSEASARTRHRLERWGQGGGQGPPWKLTVKALKNGGFPIGISFSNGPIFSGYVSFREGICEKERGGRVRDGWGDD